MTSPFDPAAISPETAAFNERLADELSRLPTPDRVGVELVRKARAEGKSFFPPSGPLEGPEWLEIEGAPGGPGRVRITRPEGTPKGRYLHIHGGGWSLGTPGQNDLFNRRIAGATGAEVHAVEYRLAPENPWPAAPDDCEAAARWLMDAHDGPVFIGGESAGAHLALVTALRLRDAGLIGRVAGLVLNYGMYDLAMTPSVRRWGERYLVLSTPVIDWFCRNLVPDDRDRADPAVSPLHADLSGLPPVLLQCGTADPLIDDTLFLGARLEAAGVETRCAIWPGGVHAFDQFPIGLAGCANAEQDAFVAGLMG